MTKPDLTTPDMLNTRQKKLLFRAWHRGTREADLLMGRFAEAYVPTASEADLDLFEALLNETDPDIYDWVTGRLEIPANDAGPIVQRLKEFYKAY